MAIPVIIDTDPGIDDAIAIALACASQEIDLLGVTTVGGNSGIENTTANALRLLHLFGRDDVPVAAGAARALAFEAGLGDPLIHGKGGLGGVELPLPDRSADPRGALALLTELVESSPEPITLIAIGPLTNVALFAATRPDLYAKLDRLVIMGGGIHLTGNHTPTAEFNIWFDPEAAARVFAAGVDVTMVGLDVTHKAVCTKQDWAPLRTPESGPVARALTEMLDFYAAFHFAESGSDSTLQHDSLAIGATIGPALLRTQHCWVGVENAGTLTRGMTVADLNGYWKRTPNAHVALDVDVAAFIKLLIGRIAELDARLR